MKGILRILNGLINYWSITMSFSWLEEIALTPFYDLKINDIIEKQSAAIKSAYDCHSNSQLNALLGESSVKFADKNTIFQL